MNIRFGGELQFGDLIAVAYSNHILFGFYCGKGSGTMQFYNLGTPAATLEDYNDWLKLSDEDKANNWRSNRYKKGFTSKCLWKSYINAVHPTRVIRVTDPEGVFTEQKDLNTYRESRDVLIKIGMIKN